MIMTVFSFFLLGLWQACLGDLPPYMGDEINIHIVTHTHDDTGWKLTVDQYYIEEVQWIFDTMIPVLKENPDRKFTYVEMAFFERWWHEQSDDMKSDVLDLIDDGQLQINLGGWCMNDEANPSASAIIQQMTDGHQFILSEFGDNARPTTGWHVDPFGHSWVTGGLWAETGFDTFGINRINYMELDQREASQDMEFIWKGSTSLGEDGYIFVHLLAGTYCTPSEIAFNNGDVWIQTDSSLPTYETNYIEIAQQFVADARTQNTYVRHNNVLIPFGCDFAHQNAYETMIQMDKLMAYINSNSTYNASIFYSTLADYTQAVHDLDLTWPVEDNDFFVYVDNAHAWWSGYFTSRPLLKSTTRSRERDMRVGEHFYVFATGLGFDFNTTAAMANLTKLRRAIDVSQHHDGITGTETQLVTDDYMYMLGNSSDMVRQFTELVAGQFLSKGGSYPDLIREGEYLMESITTSNRLAWVVYNSLAWKLTQVVKLPCNRSDLVVYDSNGNLVSSQINPVAEYAQPFKYPCKYIFYVLLEDLPPLSMTTFFMQEDAALAHVGRVASVKSYDLGHLKRSKPKSSMSFISSVSDTKVGSGDYTLYFDETTGFLSTISNNRISKEFSVSNEWKQYVPTGGDYADGMQNSGAYIFRPAQDNRYQVGSQTSNNYQVTLKNRVSFDGTATANPGFITQTFNVEQSDASNIHLYSGTVCSVTSDSSKFTFNYYANNQNDGWDDEPYFDWIEFDNANTAERDPHGYLDDKTYGTVSVQKSSTNSASVNIDLSDENFSSSPRLLVSVRGSDCSAKSSYAATITSLDSSGASVYIARIDSSDAFAEDVYLDWMAWEPSQSSEYTTEGTASFSFSSSDSSVQSGNIKLSVSDFIVSQPVVLVSVKQTAPIVSNADDVYFYLTNTFNNAADGFGLYLELQNSDSLAQTINVTVTYWALERGVLDNYVSENVTNTVITGDLLDEVQQVWKENYSQSFVVFNNNASESSTSLDLSYIDVQAHVGPLDQGAEFFTRFATSLNNNNTIYTNQNDLEFVTRRYNATVDERIAGNYYPSASQAYMSNIGDEIRFSTIVDVAHGVGSHDEGVMDLMLHRRCLEDDSRGVGEVLNETTHIEPKIWIVLDESDTVARQNRVLFNLQQFYPTNLWQLTNMSITEWSNAYKTSFSGMGSEYNTTGLEKNIHLQEMRYVYSGTEENGGLVMQLQHLFEIGESEHYSVNESISLSGIVNEDILQVSEATEMTLTANLPLAELNRLQWNVETKDGKIKSVNTGSEIKRRIRDDGNGTLTMRPRDIRTFVINQDVSKVNRQPRLMRTKRDTKEYKVNEANRVD